MKEGKETMLDKMIPGLAAIALLIALQLYMQREEKGSGKWIGIGLMVLSAAIWVYTTRFAPEIRPAGMIISWLEPFVPIPK